MLINTYKEFSLNETVSVKKQILYDFVLSSLSSGSSQMIAVMDYAFNEQNILTIAEIDFEPLLVLPASFSFKECKGNLFYGQFIKSFPTFYLISSNYFKG